MTKPSLSIVVPVYNTEKYLRRCMDSIMNQTLKDIEIIIVDDGSKEACAVLCDEISKTDSRIKVVHKENGGLGFARNSGVEAATGVLASSPAPESVAEAVKKCLGNEEYYKTLKINCETKGKNIIGVTESCGILIQKYNNLIMNVS